MRVQPVHRVAPIRHAYGVVGVSDLDLEPCDLHVVLLECGAHGVVGLVLPRQQATGVLLGALGQAVEPVDGLGPAVPIVLEHVPGLGHASPTAAATAR